MTSLTKVASSIININEYKSNKQVYNLNTMYSDGELTQTTSSLKQLKDSTMYEDWEKEEFTDIVDDAYYYDAVTWALKNNISNGITGKAFSPHMICTRAQMVTLFWRAIGSPNPKSTVCKFTDIYREEYYYDAILWATNNCFATGTSASKFSPNLTVTRGQAATFMWRTAGKPVSKTENIYSDIFKADYCYEAVLWQIEKEITKGTSKATFSPVVHCSRAHMVTFLYRYLSK